MAAIIRLIDDAVRLRQLLPRILEREGYTLLKAENARAELDLLEHEEIQKASCGSFSSRCNRRNTFNLTTLDQQPNQ